MKVLLFKISSCNQCQRQERVYKEHSINYVPCELFKNRDLARRYGVTDVPCTVVLDDDNGMLRKYDTLLSDNKLDNLTDFLKIFGK